MNKEKQRIKIAEACGWKDMFIENNRPLLGRHEPESMGRDYLCVPDYLNDLNAMHEAQKILKLGMRNRYDAELSLIAERDYCFIWETSTEQKAEAFLRTLDLWEQ